MMNDVISRQAVFDIVDDLRGEMTVEGYWSVVERVKALPSAQPETHDKRTKTHSCDCISRQAAMEEISKQQTYKMFEGEDTLYLDANDVGSVLASLPSAQPERKTGRWIPQKDKWGDYVTTVDGYVCSECNNFDCMEENYCPNCGARMEGEG